MVGGELLNGAALRSRVAALMDSHDKVPATKVPMLVRNLVADLISSVELERALQRAPTKRLLTDVPRGAHEALEQCFLSPSDKASVGRLGAGAFGEVFRVKVRGKGKAADAGAAVKVDRMALFSGMRGSEVPDQIERWKREVAWAVAAGKAGVGPRVHEAFVCAHEQAGYDAVVYGVTAMDVVEGGVTLHTFRKSAAPKQIEAAMRIVNKKLDRLHAIGIVTHGDLHAENVMVQVKGGKVADAWILDYGFTTNAKQAREDEDHMVHITWNSDQPPGDPRAFAAKTLRIARALIAEGAITLGPVPSDHKVAKARAKSEGAARAQKRP